MTTRTTKKVILILVLCVAIVSVLAGCGAFKRQLDTPELTFNAEKGIINWDSINDAYGYNIAYGEQSVTVREPSFKLPKYGKYTVTVTAIPFKNEKNFKDSEPATIDVTYTKSLEAPKVSITRYVEGDIKYVIENFDPLASRYDFVVNGVTYSVKVDRGILDTNLADGKYDIEVKAIGDDIVSRDSSASNTSVNIKPVEKRTATYVTTDTENDFTTSLSKDNGNVAKVFVNLYEIDAKSYNVLGLEDYNEFVLDANILLAQPSDKPVIVEIHYSDTNITIIEITIEDNRKVDFGDTDYISVYVGNPATIQFNIFSNKFVSLEVRKVDGTIETLQEGTDYIFHKALLTANVVVNNPRNDDKSLIFTFEKDGMRDVREIKYYFQETKPHLSTTHVTYNKASEVRSDVYIKYPTENIVTDVKLDFATLGADFFIEGQSGYILVKSTYLDRFDGGAIIVGRAYFGSEYSTFTIHIIDNANMLLSTLEQDEYVYSTDRTDSLTVLSDIPFQIKNVSFDGKILETKYYSSSNNRIILDAGFLSSLEAGTHELRIHVRASTTYDMVATITIEPANIIPSGINVTIDNTYPYVSVNFKSIGKDITSYVTNSRTGNKYYNVGGDNRVLVPYIDMEDGDMFTVTHMRNGEVSVSPEQRYTKVDLTGIEKYFNARFTYGGNIYDAVITSDDELVTFVHYALMRISKMKHYDSKNIVTDVNDTMLWSAMTGDFDYSVKIFTPFIKFDKTTYIKTLTEKIKAANKIYKEPSKMTFNIVKSLSNNVPECEIQFKVWSTNEPYAVDEKGHEVTKTRYKLGYESAYKTANPRPSSFNDFKINKWTKTQSVFLADELYYAIEDGARPIPVKGSPAEEMYDIIKDVMREIVDDSMSEHQKFMAIFEWITTNVTYDHASAQYESKLNDNNYYLIYPRRCFYLEGVFIDKVAVCNGLAKAIVVMCGLEGINAYKVMGGSSAGRHAWVKAKLDGIWYASDPTWGGGAADWTSEPQVEGKLAEGLNHLHTMVADSIFEKGGAHRPDAIYKATVGNIDYNYFANRYIGRVDVSGEINTLHITSRNDIMAIVDVYKDEALLNGYLGISYESAVRDISINEEIVADLRLKTGYDWVRKIDKTITSKYGKNYKFVYFEKGNEIAPDALV